MEPPAVIVGVAGAPGSVNVAETVLDVQAFVKVKLYVPAPKPETVTGRVTLVMEPLAVPVQDKSPVAVPEITTLPSVAEQAVGLLCVPMVMAGVGFTVTLVVADAPEIQPLTVDVTVIAAELLTVMDCVVSPVDQVFPVEAEEVSTTLPPEQKVVALPAVIVGVAGTAFTVSVAVVEFAEPQPLVTTARYL